MERQKVITVTWQDDFCPATYRLSALRWNLKVVDEEPQDDGSTVVTLKGAKADVEAFKEEFYDFEDMSPMCSRRDLSDLEYAEWLKGELEGLGVAWEIPEGLAGLEEAV